MKVKPLTCDSCKKKFMTWQGMALHVAFAHEAAHER